MLKLFPQNNLKNFPHPFDREAFERAACYNELRQFCNASSVPRETLDRALKQYAFECKFVFYLFMRLAHRLSLKQIPSDK